MDDYVKAPVVPHIAALARRYKVSPATANEWRKNGNWDGMRSAYMKERRAQRLQKAGVADPLKLPADVYQNLQHLKDQVVALQHNSNETKTLSGIDKFIATYTKLLSLDRTCRLTLGVIEPGEH